MTKNQFENPVNNDADGRGSGEDSEYIKKVIENSNKISDEEMIEMGKSLLGTLNVTLINLIGIKNEALSQDSIASESLSYKESEKKLSRFMFLKIQALLSTGRIKFDDIITRFSEKDQERLKNMFEIGWERFLIDNDIN